MPRRHGWLQDYEYEQSWPNGRRTRDDDDEDLPRRREASPIQVTVNINLGDILSQIASGKKSTKEALNEMLAESKRQRKKLLTEEDNE